jgi:serine/threonine protein kinase
LKKKRVVWVGGELSIITAPGSGPVTLGLLEHVNDDQWCSAMIKLNSSFNKDNPARPFRLWDERGFPGLESDFKRLVGRMMALDPAERATADELLEDPWWHS